MKIGDIVRFLNTTGGGKVVRLDGQLAYVEDSDGFEVPVLQRECVVVQDAESASSAAKASSPDRPAVGGKSRKDEKAGKKEEAPSHHISVIVEPEPDLPVEETPTGDRLNIVLAYEPIDRLNISTTTFDAYLVNDSNYFLYLTYMTRADHDKEWTVRYAGLIEPNMQVLLCEVVREHLAEMDRVCVQFIVFKRDKSFELKAPVSLETPLDTTKFCRLHCFRPNTYFDNDVLALPLVVDDKVTARNPLEVYSENLDTALKSKKREDSRKGVPVRRRNHKDDGRSDLVVDLHITELLDNTAGLTSADMLNYQIDKFREVMDSNLRNHGRKIVFIHGKGDGVLRQALLKEMKHRYKGHSAQDASFREYGYGATQITIR